MKRQQLLWHLIGHPAGHHFVWSNVQTLIVGCESTDRDRVLKAIYEDLKHGAGQLSKSRPSMLACQLEDIDDEGWNQLHGESGLAAMSGRLLLESPRTKPYQLCSL